MGLAASQARFLTLTARKSNIEYEGQQVNQTRMMLANKSADVVNKMLALSPPTPPTSSSNSYYKVAQTLTNKTSGTTQKISGWTIDDTSSVGNFRYAITYTYMNAGIETIGTMYTPYVASQALLPSVLKVDDATGQIVKSLIIDKDATASSGTNSVLPADADTYDDSELLYGTSFDDLAYNESMNQYDFDKYTYEKAIADINAETSGIQSKDKSLELKLKQLDSEHSAIQTEMEAVKAVITKNIENTFKTFS